MTQMNLSRGQKQTQDTGNKLKTLRNRLKTRLSRGVGEWGERDGLGDWGSERQAVTYRMGGYQGPTVKHREVVNIPG